MDSLIPQRCTRWVKIHCCKQCRKIGLREDSSRIFKPSEGTIFKKFLKENVSIVKKDGIQQLNRSMEFKRKLKDKNNCPNTRKSMRRSYNCRSNKQLDSDFTRINDYSALNSPNTPPEQAEIELKDAIIQRLNSEISSKNKIIKDLKAKVKNLQHINNLLINDASNYPLYNKQVSFSEHLEVTKGIDDDKYPKESNKVTELRDNNEPEEEGYEIHVQKTDTQTFDEDNMEKIKSVISVTQAPSIFVDFSEVSDKEDKIGAKRRRGVLSQYEKENF